MSRSVRSSRSFIPHDDITDLDIISGTGQLAYNHVGNIRFRFLISFNLYRFKETKNRKLKSKVIDSILDQLIFEGCRFLKEAIENSNSIEKKKNVAWEVMNTREARTKVAHALRDKRQCHDLSAVLARLKARTGVQGNDSDLESHSHYIAANAMLLTVKISLQESEARVNRLLCNAIDSVGLDTGFVGIPTFETTDLSRQRHRTDSTPTEILPIVVTRLL